MGKRLDRNKPFATVHGNGAGYQYLQDGLNFGADENEIENKSVAELADDAATASLAETAKKVNDAIVASTTASGTVAASQYAAEDAQDFQTLAPLDYIMKHMGRGKYNVIAPDGTVTDSGLDKDAAADKVLELNASQEITTESQLAGQLGDIEHPQLEGGAPGAPAEGLVAPDPATAATDAAAVEGETAQVVV